MTLAVQLHSLRHACANNLGDVLNQLKNLQIGAVEICAFPQWQGSPWGDFGGLGSFTPGQVKSAFEEAGLSLIACHISPSAIAPGEIAEAMAWVESVGVTSVVLPAISVSDSSDAQAWSDAAARLNQLGQTAADHNLQFVCHTQVDTWLPLEGGCGFEILVNETDAALCQFEVDPSGAALYHADWLTPLLKHQRRVYSVHLRDASAAVNINGQYLPALALGEGELNWAPALADLAESSIRHYILEMETQDPNQVFAATQSSLDFFHAHYQAAAQGLWRQKSEA